MVLDETNSLISEQSRKITYNLQLKISRREQFVFACCEKGTLDGFKQGNSRIYVTVLLLNNYVRRLNLGVKFNL